MSSLKSPALEFTPCCVSSQVPASIVPLEQLSEQSLAAALLKSTSTIDRSQLPKPNRKSRRSDSSELSEASKVILPADVAILLNSSQFLLKDLQTLRGEFVTTSPIYPIDRVFVDFGYPDDAMFPPFEVRIRRLLAKIEEREAEQERAKRDREVIFPDECLGPEEVEDMKSSEKDWSQQILEEQKEYDQLCGSHEESIENIRSLRKRLEHLGQGDLGIYEYATNVQYKVIGSQFVPPNVMRVDGSWAYVSATEAAAPTPKAKEATTPAAKKPVKAKASKRKTEVISDYDTVSEDTEAGPSTKPLQKRIMSGNGYARPLGTPSADPLGRPPNIEQQLGHWRTLASQPVQEFSPYPVGPTPSMPPQRLQPTQTLARLSIEGFFPPPISPDHPYPLADLTPPKRQQPTFMLRPYIPPATSGAARELADVEERVRKRRAELDTLVAEITSLQVQKRHLEASIKKLKDNK